MTKPKSQSRKTPITRYVFLILGAAILILVLISWFAFPGWRSQPGGFWGLLGLAAVGAVSVVKNVIAIIKDVREIDQKTPRHKPPTPQQTQRAIRSEDIDQSMENAKGNQSQTAEDSKRVRQSMK